MTKRLSISIFAIGLIARKQVVRAGGKIDQVVEIGGQFRAARFELRDDLFDVAPTKIAEKRFDVIE